MSTPAENLDAHEPTEEEIAAAAEQERKDAEAATRALRDASKETAPPKRGPGRPKGSTNKSKTSSTARDAGKTSNVTTKKPLTGAAASAVAKKSAEQRAAHKETVKALTDEAMSYRTHLVSGIGMLTGLPPDFLVGIAGDEHGNPLDTEGRPLQLGPTGEPLPGQEPAVMLTHYGEALAPKEWQVRIPIDAGLRLMDSEQGARLIEMWERYAPTLYGVAAVACVGIYTVTTLQAVSAIKPMVEIEMKQRADAAANARAQDSGPTTPGGSS